MKRLKIFATAIILTFSLNVFGQQGDYNPYEKYGKESKVLTLSNGRFVEFHDLDTLVEIGSAVLNTKTMKIVGLIQHDTLYSEATLEPEVVSRWLSPDPLAAKYPEDSPYMFAGNSPIIMIDGDGLEKVVVSGHPGGTHKNTEHFLSVGLNRAKSLKSNAGSEQVTWVIYQSANTEKDGVTYTGAQMKPYIKKAKAAGIKVLVVNSTDEANQYVNYKNGGETRDNDLITDFVYVGHSFDTELLPGYKGSGGNDAWDLDDLQKGAFSDNSDVNLCAACNTANWNLFIDNPAEDAAEAAGGTVTGSSGTVFFPGVEGGNVSDETLQKKYGSSIVTIKGTGGVSNQTKSEKKERNANRPTKTAPKYR